MSNETAIMVIPTKHFKDGSSEDRPELEVTFDAVIAYVVHGSFLLDENVVSVSFTKVDQEDKGVVSI